MGFDLAALWKPYQNLNVGVNLQDVTTTLLVWDTGRQEAITPTAKIGVAYFWESPLIAGRIIPAFDMDIRFENRRYSSQFNLGNVSFDTHVGLEYQFRQLIALRMGLDTGRFAAGAGFTLPTLKIGSSGVKLPRMNVDYAFLSHDELGDTHRISLILIFEEQELKRRSR